MTDEQIEKLVQMNQRLLFILGFGSTLILQLKTLGLIDNDPLSKWYIEAIDNLVYLDKPLPPMP